MDEKMENKCQKCNKTFVTKYTLKKHIDKNICDELHQPTKEEKPIKIQICTSVRCDYKTPNKSDLSKHLKTCKYIELDNIINHIKQEHLTQINHLKQEHLVEIEHKNKEIEILRSKEEWMEKEQERMTSLLEKLITKPAVTNNTTTNNHIRGNNNNLQSFLAPPELYQQQVDPERIKALDHSLVEKHFWLGQKGIARLCAENIIKVTDENGDEKMLLCCTDAARKRFKYVDEDHQLADDMEARHFIDAVSEPIVTVCRKVYDGVVKKIEDDKKETEDAFDLNLLENKTNIAQQKFLEINDIRDHNRNSDYKNEMTILLKK